MYLAERKILYIVEQIKELRENHDLDNYISLYRCALKIADILVTHNVSGTGSRALGPSKNAWQRLMRMQQFNHWSQFFIHEAEFVHRLEDGFIRWIARDRYIGFIVEVHNFLHDAQKFLDIDRQCELCLVVRSAEFNLELVS